jgi:amidophosphoribosyltransferase
MHKGSGLVRDVFRTRNMRALPGNMGIAHCRYPTAGSAFDAALSQPFYVNSPFGIVLGHNGNLTNAEQLKEEMFRQDLRHINTSSDSEVLLNTLAHELQATANGLSARSRHHLCRGGRRASALPGRLRRGGDDRRSRHACLPRSFRHPAAGLRHQRDAQAGTEYLFASESVALDTLGFQVLRDVAPGEAIFIDLEHRLHQRQCATESGTALAVHFRVCLSRAPGLGDRRRIGLRSTPAHGRASGRQTASSTFPLSRSMSSFPIPDSSRPSAMQLAQRIGVPYREGFVKNRYIGRTFIMPGQATRARSVRQKLNTVAQEFKGKRVLLVDDSIVRGTTSREIVEMARAAGALKVYFASASPPVRYPNVYGIDMPTRGELIATGRTGEEIGVEIGADALVYQDLDALKASVRDLKPSLCHFDTSCFDGSYVTGDVSPST